MPVPARSCTPRWLHGLAGTFVIFAVVHLVSVFRSAQVQESSQVQSTDSGQLSKMAVASLNIIVVDARDDSWRAALDQSQSVWNQTYQLVPPNYESVRSALQLRWHLLLPVTSLGASIARQVMSYCEQGQIVRIAAPPEEAFVAFDDKGRLQEWLHQQALSHFALHEWSARDWKQIAYPVFLKARTGVGGMDIRLIHSSGELLKGVRALGTGWLGKVIIQEAILQQEEWTSHFVASRGVLVDSMCYCYRFDAQLFVKQGSAGDGLVSAKWLPCNDSPLTDDHLHQIIARAQYHGIGCLNFKQRKDGTVAIFDINSRICASLVHEPERLARFVRQLHHHIVTNNQIDTCASLPQPAVEACKGRCLRTAVCRAIVWGRRGSLHPGCHLKSTTGPLQKVGSSAGYTVFIMQEGQGAQDGLRPRDGASPEYHWTEHSACDIPERSLHIGTTKTPRF